jgi:phosphomannomutase
MIKLIVFDLDGTLAQSKSPIDAEMSKHLNDLLAVVKVAVISGGDWPQFQKQLLANLRQSKGFANLSLLPTSGTKFFRFEKEWKKLYSEDFSDEQKGKIIGAFQEAIKALKLTPEKTWGKVVEDRGSQITFSGLGQEAPLAEK